MRDKEAKSRIRERIIVVAFVEVAIKKAVASIGEERSRTTQ